MKQYDLTWDGPTSGGVYFKYDDQCGICGAYISDTHQIPKSMGVMEKLKVSLSISKPKTIKVCQDCYRDEQIKKLID